MYQCSSNTWNCDTTVHNNCYYMSDHTNRFVPLLYCVLYSFSCHSDYCEV